MNKQSEIVADLAEYLKMWNDTALAKKKQLNTVDLALAITEWMLDKGYLFQELPNDKPGTN